jgi:hypothetical protein
MEVTGIYIKIKKIIIITAVFLLFNCPNPTEPSNGELISNEWVTIGDRIVFYSDQDSGCAGHRFINANELISGIGMITVEVNKVSGTSDVEFGIGYRHPDIWGQSINFFIRSSGLYNVGWLDDSGDNGVNAEYNETGWTNSDNIIKGLNVINRMGIEYNSVLKEFIFYINGEEVFKKIFEYINTGYLSYDTSLDNDVSESNPYRFEFKTTSPYVYP